MQKWQMETFSTILLTAYVTLPLAERTQSFPMLCLTVILASKPSLVVTPKSNLEHSIRKTFHPQGFTVEAGTQVILPLFYQEVNIQGENILFQ